MDYFTHPNDYTLNETFGHEGGLLFRPRAHHKKVFRGVKKVVSKVVSSPIGKVALAAAAIYTGGSALGLFGAGAAGGAASTAAISSEALLAGKVGTSALASSAFSAASIASGAKNALSALSVINSFSGSQKDQIVQDYAPVIAAQRRAESEQALAQDQQESVIARQQNQADQKEQELSAQLAASKNAVLSRRKGRGGLAFAGPNTGLKTTFGG